MILEHTSNLCNLQGPKLKGVAAPDLAKHTIDTLNLYRSDYKCDKCLDHLATKAVEFKVNNQKSAI